MDKSQPKLCEMKRNVTSLFKLAIRCISQNISSYTESGYLEFLPTAIKCTLVKQMTTVRRGFHDDRLFECLLNEKIDILNLSTSTITDNTLKLIGQLSTNLCELKLSGGRYNFTKRGLFENIPKLENLKIFQVKLSDEVGDDLIIKLGENCSHLEYLDVEGCKNVTDASIDGIKHLRLNTINLAKTKISDESLRMLGTSECSKYLSDLNVGYCAITETGMAHLRWDLIEFIGFEGCCFDNLEFIITDGKLKFLQWSI